MRENHPIDDLFQGLVDAEVAPPASVWESIVVQQSWSDRMLISLRKYWWVPLLFLTVTGAGIGIAVRDQGAYTKARSTELPAQHEGSSSADFTGASTEMQIAEQEQVSTGSKETTSTTLSDNAINGTDPTHSNEAVAGSLTPLGTTSIFGHSEIKKEERGNARAGSDPAVVNAQANQTATGTTDRDTPEEDNTSDTHAVGASGYGRGGAFNKVGGSELMAFRPIHFPDRQFNRPSLRGGGRVTGSAGYIPPGDWWFGASASYSDLTFAHDGPNRALVDLLNTSERGSHSISIDVLGGRIWRSGFFLSAGIGTQTFSTKFSYDESVDMTVSATNRYSMFRLPVSMGWQMEIGRMEIGPKVGIIAEFGTSRKGFTLAEPQATDSLNTGQLALISLDDPSVIRRYGVGLSGVASLHIGLKFSEYWSIWASPEYASRLTTWSNDPLSITADRIGMRFGFRYIIPY
jgi:hypothetical protein